MVDCEASEDLDMLDYTVRCVDEEIEQNDVRDVLKRFVPEFEDVDPTSIRLRVMTGGLSNKLYKASIPTLSVMVRIFGEGTELLIDRQKEAVLSRELYRNELASRYYGDFVNGCVYGFIRGVTLTQQQIHEEKYYTLIAKELARWHSVDLKIPKSMSRTITVFRQTKEWAQLCMSDPKLVKHFSTIDMDFYAAELAKLEQHLYIGDSLVFCHNDLLPGNVILDPSGTKVSFIDYEYSSFNPFYFDIANHFIEWAFDYESGTVDWKFYPTPEQQRAFITIYLNARSTNNEVDEEVLEQTVRLVEEYSLVGFLFWGFWGILQTNNSNIDYDYKAFTHARFKAFNQRLKYLSARLPHLTSSESAAAATVPVAAKLI